MASITYNPPPTCKRFIKEYLPGQLFYSWIDGPVGCLPADSEFLTPSGWKRMDAWRPGDMVGVYDPETRTMRFEQAEYVRLPSREPFHVFDSGSLRMELSPEHKVLYQDYRGRAQICTADQMARQPSKRTIPTTFRVAGADRRPDLSDTEIRWRVAFSADGHSPVAGLQSKVTLRKERKKERLRKLLEDLGAQWREVQVPDRPTETTFWVRDERATPKSLEWVWGLSARQLEIVLDEVDHWDGLHDHAEKRFSTTVKENADAIQYAAHATGRRASIRVWRDPRDPAWAPLYTVSICVGDNPKNRAMVRGDTTRISTREAPDGMKYCFTTSTGFFVARCADTVFVTGNSGKTTALFFKLVTMAKLQEPGPDGIRRSRAVVVRNTLPQLKDTTLTSWGYWFKHGEAGVWRETDKKFTLMFDDVECEVLFRALDTADDVARVLSLEITFAVLDEFVQIPRAIVDALSARLGRYPSAKDGGATNWGMFGASNPDTEDNWWHDYLHKDLPDNAFYYSQPSGLSDKAENLENLPGGQGYYLNQAKGKPKAWIMQFIEAKWGFSAAGRPVIESFNPELHISRTRLLFDPHLPLVAGFDPGLGGSAFIFGQQDLTGRVRVLGELIQTNMGAQRLIDERLKPYLRSRFPDAQVIIAPDPAAAYRNNADEKTVTDVLRKHFDISIETNNRLSLRVDALDHYTTRLVGSDPAFLIDEQACPVYCRAMRGGWRYAMDPKKDMPRSPEPEKNAYSHPGDAGGYLARYFHRDNERVISRQRRATQRRPVAANIYHFT